MKKIFAFFGAIIAVAIISTTAFAADQSDTTPLQGLDRVESIIYGEPMTGGLLLRLSKVERDLFGMELPGSLTERQQALQIFVEKGSSSQPSMMLKMAVAEWVTLRKTNSLMPFASRVQELEVTLEGEAKEGALSPRLEQLIMKILPAGITASTVVIPASTVFRGHFVDAVTVRTVKVGDRISLETDEDCVINSVLAVPKGSRLIAEITKVKMPASFGRSSEIQFAFKEIEAINGTLVPVAVGEEAEKAMKVDSASLGAVGASLAGAIALGPVGLVGGLLVRGNDNPIPAGTSVYVQTVDNSSIEGYPVPETMDLFNGTSTSDQSTEQTTSDSTVY